MTYLDAISKDLFSLKLGRTLTEALLCVNVASSGLILPSWGHWHVSTSSLRAKGERKCYCHLLVKSGLFLDIPQNISVSVKMWPGMDSWLAVKLVPYPVECLGWSLTLDIDFSFFQIQILKYKNDSLVICLAPGSDCVQPLWIFGKWMSREECSFLSYAFIWTEEGETI